MKNSSYLRGCPRGRVTPDSSDEGVSKNFPQIQIGGDADSLDTSPNFFQKVYALVANIPFGKVASYGQIAAMAGAPRNARTVGYAMNGVPEGSNLPCHRVVYKDGSLAPEYAFGGAEIQRALLKSEGVTFLPDGRIDMEKCVWREDK